MLLSSLSVSEKLQTFLERDVDITAQLGTPIDEVTADNTGFVSEQRARELLGSLDVTTMIMEERTKGWYQFINEITEADTIDESEEVLRYQVSVLNKEVKSMSFLLALIRLAFCRTELSGCWKPWQREFRAKGEKAIRAVAGMRNAHIDMSSALQQWLPQSESIESVYLSSEEMKAVMKHSESAWGMNSGKWG